MAKANTTFGGATAGKAADGGRRKNMPGRHLRVITLGLVAGLTLAACEEREVILTGERLPPRAVMADQVPGDIPQVPVNQSKPISLPAVTNNADWTQAPGTPATRVSNAALSASPQLAWSSAIGAGDSRKAFISASPVVAGGRIFTLDSGAMVTATSTSGQKLWSVSLVPARDKGSIASGGGLAYGNGKLYVTSGYGTLTALDPASGGIVWQQRLLAAATGAPTVGGGLVYITSGNDTAWALNADNGLIQWQLSATPVSNTFSGAPAPALSSQYVTFGFGSGEVQTAFRKGGLRLWDTMVSGRRVGYARSNVEGITGAPMVSGSTVYTGNASGRTVSLELESGQRNWTADEGPMGNIWPAGDSVFMVSDLNQLLRLDASSGDRIWGVDLPLFVPKKPRKMDAVYAHYGPILAGSRLVLASSDGLIRFFSPTNGVMTGSVEIPGGAASAPVVAGGTLYVVSKDGKLLAYR